MKSISKILTSASSYVSKAAHSTARATKFAASNAANYAKRTAQLLGRGARKVGAAIGSSAKKFANYAGQRFTKTTKRNAMRAKLTGMRKASWKMSRDIISGVAPNSFADIGAQIGRDAQRFGKNSFVRRQITSFVVKPVVATGAVVGAGVAVGTISKKKKKGNR